MIAHPRGGRLAASVGTQESRNNTGLDLEREIVDDRATAITLGETAYFDHGKFPSLQNARALNSRTPSNLERQPESALKMDNPTVPVVNTGRRSARSGVDGR